MSHPNPQRQLRLNLRRRIRISTRHTVEDIGEGRVRLTCKVCGRVSEEVPGASAKAVKTGAMPAPEPGSFQAKFMAKWWTDGRAGVQGDCPTCTQNERDRRYPLHPGGKA